MAIKFLNHLDLTQNEIQNTALHNTESSDITTPVDGQIIFDNGSGVNKLKYYDGSSWVSVGSSYSHPTHTALTIDLDATGASVISTIDFTSDGLGHVTSATATTRTLTLSDLGYTGDSDANNYVHPTHPGDDFSVDTGALVGAVVVSDIDINVTTDTLGHVTDASGTVATRTLTLSDLGYTGATDANNYVHPNHTGHVTSTGDGATVLTVSAITGQTALTSGLAATDEFVISDNGVIKRMDVSVLETYMQNNLTFTSNTDVDVSVSNLITRLGQISENVTIGDASDVTVTIPGDLVVTGTTTTNNVETISTSNGVIFEGNSADSNELTLLAGTLTADRTITLPDATGTVALTSDLHDAVTLSGSYDYLTISGQVITLNQIDYDTDIANTPTIPTVNNATITLAAGNAGITMDADNSFTTNQSGNEEITISHADTSSQSSVNNSGRTYIQDITLDTFGHITGITSATETVTNTDTQLATKEADIDVSNTTFIANKRATINHALNSENVIVQMYDKTTGAVVHADVEHTSDGSTISKNHVRIEFGVVPANDIRVIMIDAKDAAASVTPSYS